MRVFAPSAMAAALSLMVACSLTSLDGLSGGTDATTADGGHADAFADARGDENATSADGAAPTDGSPVDAGDAAGRQEAGITDASDARPAESGAAEASVGCYLADALSPALPDSTDNVPYSMGTRVRASVAATARKMRFWRAPSEPNTAHTGTLWGPTGSVLATATIPPNGAPGWAEGTFSSPVSLTPGVYYIVSVDVSSNFGATTDVFSGADLTCPTGQLIAPQSNAGTPNGLFGLPGALPTQTYSGSFYFVDLYVD